MPEKTINQMPPEWRKCFTRGNDALSRENYEYAMDLYTQVLEADPSFYEARKALRAAQQGKASKGGGFFKKMMSGAGNTPLYLKAQSTLRSNPAGALSLAEQMLNADPNSSQGHKIVVEAATALEMPRTAVLSLEVLYKNSPNDRDVAVNYGKALADIGETSRAEKVLMEFIRAVPNDMEAVHVLKDLSARHSMKEGGYDAAASGKGSFRDMLKDKDQATALEQESKVQKTEDTVERLMGEYEARLKTEPGNAKIARSLAELYTQKNQFEQALATYERIKNTDAGSDSALDKAIADTTVKRYDYQIEQLDQQDPDYAAHVAKINAEKLAFQIADCQKRVEKFPTDLVIRYEMGQLYFQAGKVGEAIQELQKAQANPNKRLASMNLLAQCFAKRKMYDLAAKTFQGAIKEKTILDEEKKDLIYNLGTVFESMGKKEEAIEQFKTIYETDIGYRDVAAKVDAYYASQ